MVDPKHINQWKREGFTDTEISAFSVIGLVLAGPEFDPQGWEAHETYGVEDWQFEVDNGYTRHGYVDWVNAKIEEAEED